MREYLAAHVRMHPIRNVASLRLIEERSTFFSLIHLITKNLHYMPITLILALLAGGSISYAAEGALPGESLYAVKTNINENVRSFLAFSDEAEASLEASFAAERLKEAEQLASRGKLNAEARVQIEENFEAHVARSEEKVKKLEKKNSFDAAVEVNTHLETSLNVHEEILTALAKEKEELRSAIKPIVLKVRVRRDQASKRRRDAEGEVSASDRMKADREAAAEGKMRAAEKKLEEVRKFLLNHRGRGDANVYEEAEVKLGLAEKLFAGGKAKFEVKLYVEAFELFQQSMRFAEETKLFVTIRNELGARFHILGNASTSREEMQEGAEEKREDKYPAPSGEGEVSGSIKINIRPTEAEESGGNGESGAKGGLRLQLTP